MVRFFKGMQRPKQSLISPDCNYMYTSTEKPIGVAPDLITQDHDLTE